MTRSCIAHIRTESDGTLSVQTATEHCRNTARLASASLASVHLTRMGYLAGLLHDMGKFTVRFEDYIRRSAAGEPTRRGSVNHTFAGVRFLLTRYHSSTCRSLGDIACEVAAYGAGAHHGLFDCVGPDGTSGFLHRLEKEDICYEEARSNFLAQCAGEAELDALFGDAVQEVTALHQRLLRSAKGDMEGAFLYAMLCRLVLSAIIDADRQDTAQFMHHLSVPQFPEDLGPIWRDCLSFMEAKLSQFPDDTPIAHARRDISDRCRTAADCAGGIYRLSVPTGGGKTLATLRYALAHAATQGKRHIFFFIPLLSVIEQNAQVIRDYVNDDSLILEHHSNLVRSDDDTGELDPRELLAETWSAPIVISTLVQFLNTLFLGKTTAIRRMCSLTDSVLVFDEIQSVPRAMLSQFNLALNFLSEVCGATVVLCSATQPCLEVLPHPLHYAAQPDMVPASPELWSAFRRTKLIDCRGMGSFTPERLAEFAQTVQAQSRSLLIICNTKRQVKALYDLLRGGPVPTFHLSTAMCMAHRIDVLTQVNELLDAKQPVLCLSTQLVEAGIDFSFGAVIRVLAGMDNAAQAAGRCNRNGEFDWLCPVYLVELQGEDLSRLPEIQVAQTAARTLLASFAEDSAPFQRDLLSDASIRYYYRRLFFDMKRGAADYPLPQLDATLLDLLSSNNAFARHAPVRVEGRYYLNQAFATAGRAFQVFQDDTTDVLVPYQKGADLIAGLCSEKARRDQAYRKRLLEQAKPYTVSLYAYQERMLGEQGGLYSTEDLCILLPDYYDPQTGVSPQHGAAVFMEV